MAASLRAQSAERGPEIIGSLALLSVLYAVSELTTITALQIPGYLLMAGFDLVQNTVLPGLSEPLFSLLFAAYLAGLSAVIGFSVHRLRSTE